MASSRLCSIQNCDKPHSAKGMCKNHYEIARRALAPAVPCSVEGCEKRAQSRELCTMHYSRWLRYGSTEAVKKASNGSVRKYLDTVVLLHSSDDCLIWPFSRDRNGRARINGYESGSACRVICEEVNGAPPTPQHEAAHSCGNGHIGCVSPMHLSWKTSKENKADELIHGTRNFGERNGVAKLDAKKVSEIRSLLGSMPQWKIAERYGVHQVTISKIRTREVWGWFD